MDYRLADLIGKFYNLVESQLVHKRKMEEMEMKSKISNKRLGLIFGFIIAVLTIVLSALCFYFKQSIPGALWGVGGVYALSKIFINNSQKQ